MQQIFLAPGKGTGFFYIMNTFTHLNDKGSASMVDVGDKPITQREAIAQGRVKTTPEVIGLLKEKKIPKGDVFSTARIAGIMAAKKVSELIPLCHSLSINFAEVLFRIDENHIVIKSTVRTTGKTGVEMEAITAVSIAAVTIYDMVKAVDKEMVIDSIHLVEKSGGRKGHYIHQSPCNDNKEEKVKWL